MKVVCSWCGKILKNNVPTNKKPHKDDSAISHGCCTDCLERTLREYGSSPEGIAAALNRLKGKK